ncbi:MAG: FkbM family methyltransferase [Chloroflexota bacterium]
MNSLITKFLAGVKADVKGTIAKSILYVLRIIGDGIADGFYVLMKIILFPVPSRTLTRLKHGLSPKTRLDYDRHPINLQADSLVDLYRARACEKEPETVQWIETYVHKGDVFYDVGANIGAYSLVACAYCSGEVKILAFEPSFSNFYQLCRNIILNKFDKSITPYMIALSKSPGVTVFNYHSLDAGSADHWLGENLPTVSSDFVYTQQLLAFSMDYLIEHFDFPIPNHIKLDVDGAEIDVLRGAEKTLREHGVKSILVEVRDVAGMSEQVHEMLLSAGFSLTLKVDRGDSLTWNCVYVRDRLGVSPCD